MGQDALKCSSRISRHFCLEAQCDYRFIYRNAEARDIGSQRRVFFCTCFTSKRLGFIDNVTPISVSYFRLELSGPIWRIGEWSIKNFWTYQGPKKRSPVFKNLILSSSVNSTNFKLSEQSQGEITIIAPLADDLWGSVQKKTRVETRCPALQRCDI